MTEKKNLNGWVGEKKITNEQRIKLEQKEGLIPGSWPQEYSLTELEELIKELDSKEGRERVEDIQRSRPSINENIQAESILLNNPILIRNVLLIGRTGGGKSN